MKKHCTHNLDFGRTYSRLMRVADRYKNHPSSFVGAGCHDMPLPPLEGALSVL